MGMLLGQRMGLRNALGRVDRESAGDSEERARLRHRRILIATFAGFGSRVITALGMLLAVPLVARSLDASELGVWSLLVTAVTLLGFADLGVNNALLNELASAVGHDDLGAARRAMRAALRLLAYVILGGAAIGASAIALFDWHDVLSVPDSVSDLDLTLAVFLALVLAGIPATLGQKVHLAYQQAWVSTLVTGIGALLGLAGVAAVSGASSSLPLFVAAMLGGPVVAWASETAWVFLVSHRDLRPGSTSFERSTMRHLVGDGVWFFLLALAGAIAYQTDAVVIANRLGSATVTRFVVAERLFALAPAAVMTLLNPLWAPYGEAYARGDLLWIRRTLRRSIVIAAIATGAAAAVLVVLGQAILTAWVPQVPASPTGLRFALGSWMIVSSVSAAVAMYLNGTGHIRIQAILALLMAAANISLSIVLVGLVGIAGPVWASVLTQVGLVLIPLAYLYRLGYLAPGKPRASHAS